MSEVNELQEQSEYLLQETSRHLGELLTMLGPSPRRDVFETVHRVLVAANSRLAADATGFLAAPIPTVGAPVATDPDIAAATCGGCGHYHPFRRCPL
jgi:hypothetical protein